MKIVYSSLPKISRTNSVAGMRFQVRDEEILQTIHNFGGVLAKRQLQSMFWSNKSARAMEKRLSKLYRNGYLDWPSQEQWRKHPIPEPICWLGWKGVLSVAHRQGCGLEDPVGSNENQLRKLQVRLRAQGFHWLREPRWIQLEHDLKVADFRMMVGKAVQSSSGLVLAEWLPERVFRSQMDIVECSVEDRNGKTRVVKKGVCPDAYFVIEDTRRLINGESHRARFLLELDMATHDNPSFGLEKVAPGAAYIRSPAYKARFGYNSGRWLVVTTADKRRMQNLMQHTQRIASAEARLFFFTTWQRLTEYDVFKDSIWWNVAEALPIPLLSSAN